MNLIEKIQTNFEKFVQTENVGDLLGDTQLSDNTSIKEPIEIKLTNPFELKMGEGNLKLDTEAKFRIQLFNNIEDTDKDDALIQKEKSFIAFNPENPILKYKLGFKMGADFKGKLDAISFGINGNTGMELVSYIKHDKTETVKKAIGKDILNLPLAINPEDIKALKEGDCVAYNCSGELGMNLSFSLTDILLACIAPLRASLELAESSVMDIEIGDEVELIFSITDNFRLAISKAQGNNYKVSVKKSKLSARGMSFKMGIKLGIKNTEKIAESLNKFSDKFLESISGMNKEDLTKLIEKIKVYLNDMNKKLEAKEEDTVIKLLKRLNINVKEENEKLRKLIGKIETVNKKINNINDLINNAQITTSISYEYERIDMEEDILFALISEDLLNKYYDNLIKLDTNTLISNSDFKQHITEYLHTEVNERTHKWGLNLGIGNLKVAVSNELDKNLKRKFQQRLDGYYKIVYQGLRKHEFTNLAKDEDEWLVDVKAEMPNFSNTPLPDLSFSEFNFGITLIQSHIEKKARRWEKDKFFAVMNTALSWDIIPGAEFRQKCENIWNIIDYKKGNTDTKITFQFQIPFELKDKDLINRIYGILANENSKMINFSRAFARTMPYIEGFELRTDVEKRTEFYSKLWLSYFNAKNIDAKTSAQELSKKIISEIQPGTFESENNPESFYQTLFSTDPKSQVNAFAAGFKTLLENIIKNNRKDCEKVIENSYDEMRKIWSDSSSAIALGAFFIELTKNTVLANSLKRTMEIEYLDKDGKGRKILLT